VTLAAFIDELPFTPPLFTTPKGDAAVHLSALRDETVVLKWLAAIHRGAGRAALAIIVEAADRHGVTLTLMARPQQPSGEGKKLTRAALEAFYAGFGFVVTGRGGGIAHMIRRPVKKAAQTEGLGTYE
jgi:hypothetical protein